MPVNSAAQSAGLILSNARGEIGFHEGANNSNKYAGYAGHGNNQAWCSTFVTWAMKKAEAQGAQIPDFVQKAEPGGAAVESYRNAYQGAGRLFRQGTPQPGDLVFFGAGGGQHIGIVERVENGKVYTIEGNTSDQVARRSYSLSDPYINSFGRTFGDKIPPDAQLGGPANLQASPGGGGGSGGGASAAGGGGGGGGGAPQAAGGGGGGGGGAAPAGGAGGGAPAGGAAGGAAGGDGAQAARMDGMMEQLMQLLQAGGSEEDVENALKKMFPGMDKKQLKQLAKAMKKHPELAKMMKAKPEMAKKLQEAAQKGGKDLGGMLKKMEHQADGFQGKDGKADPVKLDAGGLASVLPELKQEVAQLAQAVQQLTRLAQAA